MDIAYQVIGDAAHDLVVLPSALMSIDSIAAEPSMNRFHQRLASFCRVIRFDYRGTGLSSRVPSPDVIGPQFWAVRLRQRVTKGPGSRAAGVAMAFKLIESAQRRWRLINATHLVVLVRAGADFKDGKLVERPDQAGGQDQAA